MVFLCLAAQLMMATASGPALLPGSTRKQYSSRRVRSHQPCMEWRNATPQLGSAEKTFQSPSALLSAGHCRATICCASG